MAAKLTWLQIKALNKPGTYAVGDGLYVQVRDNTHKSWLFRFMRLGKAASIGLGRLEDVSLADARETAQGFRRDLRAGIDPKKARDDALAAAKAEAERNDKRHTFQAVAEEYVTTHEASWRNPKHRQQWRNTLETDVYPTFGDKPIADIDTDDVVKALKPIWLSKPETASRLRGRIEAILAAAGAKQMRTGPNPATWRNHLEHWLPEQPKKAERVQHHPALPWQEIGDFVAGLRARPGTAARALEFIILTACRSGEAFGATWAEIDMGAKVWTVPGARMKAKREHRVPLSEPALAILREQAKARTGDDPTAFIFPGRKAGRPLSDMSLTMMLRGMKRAVTTHGFRSTFRDWCAEATNYPREVAEQALAHTLKDKVEAAYRRGDALEKRRKMMEAWAEFCSRPSKGSGQVVPIRAAS